MQTLKNLLAFHGLYLFAAALWPMVDMQGFMSVTGHKTDQWLVKSASLLTLPVSLCFLLQYPGRTSQWEPFFILGISSAAGMAWIDFYYALNGLIPTVYLLDGSIQVLFMMAWFSLLLGRLRRPWI